jgi:hypothetical protein
MKNKESPFKHIDKLYRIDGKCYAACLDEYENPMGIGSRELRVSKFDVVRATPTGVWIQPYSWDDSYKKFVRLTASKKYACETIELAKESFIARKNRQIRILSARLRDARTFLELAKNYSNK